MIIGDDVISAAILLLLLLYTIEHALLRLSHDVTGGRSCRGIRARNLVYRAGERRDAPKIIAARPVRSVLRRYEVVNMGQYYSNSTTMYDISTQV